MKLKRLGTLLLTAIIAATTLAGCGAMPSTGNGNETGENASVIAATEEDTDGQITLRVVDWSDGSATQREEFHKKFEEAHPDIKIEYTMLTVDQFKNTIVTMIKSGEGPDLFPIPVGLTLNTAVEEGWFQPINDYVTDEFRNKFDPEAFAEGVTDIGNQMKRRDFALDELLNGHEEQMNIFMIGWEYDEEVQAFIPSPIKEYPLTDYRRVQDYE